jgi:hypothetical protein
MKYIILIILILFTISCSLDRTNPLDPLVSDEGCPGNIFNVEVELHVNNIVTITWDPVSGVDGYFVYRSQSYDGLYELITPGGITVNDYDYYLEFLPEGFFWYKVSAYIELDEGKLEGYRSEPKTWN